MFQIQQFEELASTNDYIKQYGKEMPHGSVIATKKQTKGRGRFARKWCSDKDLTFSICFAPTCFAHQMASALAVLFALESFQIEAWIKWPNDILYQDKKCGGILIERVFEGTHACFDVVGIGLNLHEFHVEELQDKASALPIENREKLLHTILYYYQMLLRMDPQSIHRQYRKYSWLIGKYILEQRYYVKDVNEQGELVVLCDGTEQLLRCDEITLTDVYKE